MGEKSKLTRVEKKTSHSLAWLKQILRMIQIYFDCMSLTPQATWNVAVATEWQRNSY